MVEISIEYSDDFSGRLSKLLRLAFVSLYAMGENSIGIITGDAATVYEIPISIDTTKNMLIYIHLCAAGGIARAAVNSSNAVPELCISR